MYDFQKASMWKRISAGLFDAIILVICVIGLALLLTTVSGYDSYTTEFQGYHDFYEEKHNIDFDLTVEEYNALTESEKELYLEAEKEFASDEKVNRVYNIILNLTLLIITFSILLSYLLLEFIVPLFFKNGQTLGKKIFGIGVMRADGVKITPVLLFARSILGKYTLETMVPVLIIIMIYFNIMGIIGTVVIFALLIIEIVMMAVTKAHTPIHDKLASTVTVDLASQMIFDSYEELLEYKKQAHAENAEKSVY